MPFCAVIEIKAILQIPEFPFAMSQYDTVKHEDLAVKMEELDLDQTNLTSCWSDDNERLHIYSNMLDVKLP